MNKILTGILSFMAILVLTGCSQSAPNAPVGETPAQSDAPLKYPEGFLPHQYPNSTVTFIMPYDPPPKDKRIGRLTLVTKDTPEQAEEFYQKEFKDGGCEWDYRIDGSKIKDGVRVTKDTPGHVMVAICTQGYHAYDTEVSCTQGKDGTEIDIVVSNASSH